MKVMILHEVCILNRVLLLLRYISWINTHKQTHAASPASVKFCLKYKLNILVTETSSFYYYCISDV